MRIAALLLALAVAMGTGAPPPSAPPPIPVDRPVTLPDGRTLNLWCAGDAGSVVLLDSGWSADSRAWGRVIPLLSADHRVCAVDRAGAGRSDAGPLPRDAGAIARDLHDAAAAAGLPPPYILVGHSLGALHMRAFAARWPGLVAALVLADPSVPHQRARLAALAGSAAAGSLDAVLARAIACREATRSGPPPGEGPLARCATSDPWRAHERWVARVSELESMDGPSSAGLDRPISAPVLILTAGRDRPASALALWQRLHAEEAARSACGATRLVPDSGHLIVRDRPDAVAEAVRLVRECNNE